MTSKQVLCCVVLLIAGGCPGCASNRAAAPLVSPYHQRQVWAVAPLRNESGSTHADGDRLADHLARQLQGVKGIDVIPVNRVLAAMAALHITDIRTEADAMMLRRTLGVDALLIGTISAYQPYDPPKLGIAIELYGQQPLHAASDVNPQKLSQAATEGGVAPGSGGTESEKKTRPSEPVDAVSGFYDAARPEVLKALKAYAGQDDQRLYRISMNLYSQFVAHEMIEKLIQAEMKRVAAHSPRLAGGKRPASQ